MTYDRQIVISTGNSRKDLNWKRQTMKVSELYERLRIPNRGVETLDEYMRMSKARQDDLKDVGGFVAGSLNGGRRKANNVTGRDVITLDFDAVPALGTDKILEALDAMNINYCVYSTRKHAPNAPRLRVLAPTDRTMTADEYEPCARRMAANIGIAMADPTTFECGRLMYWPSVCSDSEYVFKAVDAPFACVDGLLRTYTDWHDITQWPQVPGSFSYAKLAVRQGDPVAKDGIIGAFCRKYDVFRAIEELLPGIYAPVDTDPNRFTYTLGSTTGGAVVYDDGKFLFSHHATDPCSNRLVNAFDLVRLHKFGDKDDAAADGTPNNRLPSYKAMCEFANGLDEVALELLKKRQKQAEEDFEGLVQAGADGSVSIDTLIGGNGRNSGQGQNATQERAGDSSENWMLQLERNRQTGEIKGSINNCCLILINDPRIRGKFGINTFSERFEVRDGLPWFAADEMLQPDRLWRDSDTNNLYAWFEKNWMIYKHSSIDAALIIAADRQQFDPVRDELKRNRWDGTPRLDTYLIDYLGAEDNEYVRTVSSIMLVAGVTRVFDPGHKFDNMLILYGPQGIGKSTLLRLLGKGKFCDNMSTFEGKDAAEQVQGVRIVEVAELDALDRSEVSTAKQFLSKTADRFRPAYGRNVVEYKRRCVFFGTTNQTEFLRDMTGNRRFWPVQVGVNQPKKSVFSDTVEQEIDQIWAEAYVRYICGAKITLPQRLEKFVAEAQESNREFGIEEGVIQDFVSKKVPEDWSAWPIERRLDFWYGNVKWDDTYHLVNRKSICAAEIWRELYNNPVRGSIRKSESRLINAIIAKMIGWKNAGPIYVAQYGMQRAFVYVGGGERCK